MPLGEALTDDYVAELLKEDAKASSARASGYNFGGSSKRPLLTAPKPNTRFLKNILRDTGSHNAALLAKEAEESEARLRRLREKQRHGGKPEQVLYSARDRHEDGRAGRIKRRRVDDEEEASSSARLRHADGRRRTTERRGDEDGRPNRREHRRERESKDGEESGAQVQSHQPKRRHASQDRDREGRHAAQDRRRSRSPHRVRRQSGERERRRDVQRTRTRSRSSASISCEHSPAGAIHAQRKCTSHRTDQSPASDSDPLESIIGPPPPPQEPSLRARGRGAFTDKSAIDTHFSSGYDPSADITPEAAELDDWDQALEAMRDRQKWQQQGAARLKAAGFTDAEVAKWEKGGEKAEDDVRWSKQGESREWDRGKVVEGDGIDVRPEWGRLKET